MTIVCDQLREWPDEAETKPAHALTCDQLAAIDRCRREVVRAMCDLNPWPDEVPTVEKLQRATSRLDEVAKALEGMVR